MVDPTDPTDPVQTVTSATVVVTAVAGAAVLLIIAVARKYGYLGGATTTAPQLPPDTTKQPTLSVVANTQQPTGEEALEALDRGRGQRSAGGRPALPDPARPAGNGVPGFGHRRAQTRGSASQEKAQSLLPDGTNIGEATYDH